MRGEQGFTYVGVLIAVAVMGVLLMSGAHLWVGVRDRDVLAETRWRGEQYAKAIKSYGDASVGSLRQYPKNLQDLVIDYRYILKKRHLRRLYENPSAKDGQWELVLTPDGSIRAVSAVVSVAGRRQTEVFGE